MNVLKPSMPDFENLQFGRRKIPGIPSREEKERGNFHISMFFYFSLARFSSFYVDILAVDPSQQLVKIPKNSGWKKASLILSLSKTKNMFFPDRSVSKICVGKNLFRNG